MNGGPQVVLDCGSDPIAIPHENVYFAFPSGRLTYDCGLCGSQCCRGHGYELRHSELAVQLGVSPSVRFFLDQSGGTTRHYHVKNCAPACFFLTSDGLCDIHIQNGMDEKPETCRLFPFNSLRRIDRYLVVNPHPAMCPLNLVPEGTRDPKSDHAQLLVAMSARPIGGAIPEANPVRLDCGALLALERQIHALAEGHDVQAGYLSLCAAQLALTRSVVRGESVGDDGPLSEEQAVAGFLGRLAEVMGAPLPASAGDTDLSALLCAMTPSLRSRLVFPREDTRHEFRCTLGLERVPYALTALLALMAHARAAGLRTVTWQSVGCVFDESQQLLRLLAHLDIPVEWRATDVLDVRAEPKGPYMAVVRDLLPGIQRKRQQPLWLVLCRHLPDDAVERAMALRSVARLLTNHIVPVGDGLGEARAGTRVRAAVQHWALRHMRATDLARRMGG